MRIELSRNELSAALTCAATKDVRYYLQGVCVEVQSEVSYSIIATNGSILFHAPCSASNLDELPGEPAEIIIPADTIKLALKVNKSSHVILEKIADKFSLNSIPFNPVDGKFPDYRRVIPETVSGETGQFNAELQETAQKALMTAADVKREYPRLYHNGLSASVYKLAHYCVVIMPCRDDAPEVYSAPFVQQFPAKQKAAA